MLTLYITRHGETEWNIEKRMQGRMDSKLTSRGEADARLLAERLHDIEFTALYTSPSGRAAETATIIKGSRTIQVIEDERLMEIQLGCWQGMTEDQIQELYREDYDHYRNSPALYKRVDGECFQDVKMRLVSFLTDLQASHDAGNLLIVSHGVVIKTMMLIFKNARIEKVWKPPVIEGSSLTVVQIERGSFKVLLEGDTSHKAYF